MVKQKEYSLCCQDWNSFGDVTHLKLVLKILCAEYHTSNKSYWQKAKNQNKWMGVYITTLDSAQENNNYSKSVS